MNRRDVLLGAAALAGCAGMNGLSNTRPIVIAHRGASAYRPEHTLAGYQLAIEQGADYIEPDLVITKDHVLVCRHENEISQTTNVADHSEFADRRKAKTVDGVEALGWWVEDFTLAELKTLRCRERIPQLRPGNTQYDGQFEIPTFAEVIALARQHSKGVYPELKHPTFLREQGVDPVPAFIGAERGWRPERSRHDVCAVLRNRCAAHLGADVLDPMDLRAIGVRRWRPMGPTRHDLRPNDRRRRSATHS